MSELGPILRSLRRHKGPSALLAMEVAMGMAVMVHLFIMGSYYYVVAFSPSGIDQDNLILVTRRFPGRAEPESSARQQAASDRTLLAKVNGVVGAAVVDDLPLPHQEAFSTVVRTEGPAGAARVAVAWPMRASEDVVAALGLRCIAGQDFSVADRDLPGSRRALITEDLARHLFPRGGAVGQWIQGLEFPRARIVGVLANFRIRQTFLPDNRSVVILADLPVAEHQLAYVVRSAPGRRSQVMAGITDAFGLTGAGASGDVIQIPSIDASSPRFHVIARGATIVVSWTGAIVLGVTLFGSLALASFSVAERTRQIGVRRALGARRGQIVGYFLLENAIVTGIGIGIGTVLALVMNVPVRRMMPSMALNGKEIAIAMAIFWSAGLLSALVPARRAARIPPTAATRSL